MRKRIALFMALIMFISIIPNSVVLAAGENDVYEFVREDNIALDPTFKENIPGSNETTLKWKFDKAGKYDLTYYIKEGTDTKTVTLSFDVSATNDVKLSTTLEGAVATAYMQHAYPYTEGAGWTTIANPTQISGLKVNGTKIEETQLSLLLGTNLKVRLKLNGNSITLTTNGIQKGYITPFELAYNSTGVGTVVDFKGFENFEILPTHLKDIGLDTTYLCKNPNVAGTEPGIKVRIKRPQYIKSGEFVTMNSAGDTEGSKVNISLALWPEFTPTQVQAASGDQNLNLQFNLGNDSTIGTTGKKTVINGDFVEVYLKQQYEGTENVIKWDQLKESSVIGGNVQLEYTITDNTGASKVVLGNKLHKSDNKGYTFLKYDASKTGEQEVELTVKPYNMNSKVTYTVYRKRVNIGTNETTPVTLATLKSSWVKELEYVYTQGDSTSQTIPIAIAKAVEQEYVITAQLENQTQPFISQRLYFNPVDIQAPPQVTQIVNIDNIYAIPGQEDATLASTPVEAAGFDLEWNAPKLDELISLLSKGDLYYELLVRSSNEESAAPSVIKTIKVSAEDKSTITTSSAIKVEVVGGSATGVGNNASGQAIGVYYPATGTFKVPGIVLKKPSQTGWEHVVTNTEFPYKGSTAYPTVDLQYDLFHQIPGTYYFSMRSILVIPNQSVIGNTDESNLIPVSIDVVKNVLPTVESISGQKNTQFESNNVIAENVTFNNVDISNYVNKSLTPAEWKLDALNKYKGSYEIFLYTLKSGGSQYTVEDFNTAIEAGYKTANANDPTRFDMNSTDLAKLRNNGIIAMKYDESDMTGGVGKTMLFTQLDPNQIYYVSMRVKLDPWRTKADGTIEYQNPRYKTSVLSKVYSFTTTTEPMPPSPEDKVPPAPEAFFIHKDWLKDDKFIGTSDVKLVWKPAPITIENEAEEKVYYEFVRSKQQLTSEQKNKSVEELVKAETNNVGFRTADPADSSNVYISTYTSKNPSWVKIDPAQYASQLELYDNNLNPNVVYYYYIRTVYVVNGTTVKSKWLMVPVTTKPVAAPINLKVEAPKAYSHNTKNEIVISFDAPIPPGGVVPTQFDFNIAVKSELDDEYKTNYSVTRLTSTQDKSLTPEGYTHFVYKITDLKSNKRYDIKVRVVDKTQAILQDGNYPTSLYSDKVSTRTDYDEDEAKQESKYEEYLKKFDQEVEKLRRKPYWVVEQGSSYKYRESYLKTELGLQKEYNLVTNEDTKSLYYYLPASVIVNGDYTNTVLNVTIGKNTMSIRPDTLTSENEAIKKAVEQVQNNDIKDYYVAIEFSSQSTSEKINGQSPLSPKLGIDMELVYMKQEDRLIEDDIMIALNDIITAERKDFITQLEKKIDKGIIANDVLQELIDDAIKEIEKDHAKQVDKIMDRQTKKTVSINEIEKPILLTSEIDAFLVEAYYYTGSWVAAENYQIGNKFGIEANKLGVYIFTGKVELVSTVPSLGAYQSFIAKYNLTDFFELTPYMIKTAATKEQVYGTAARILGAQRGTDYLVFLKNKGIKGTSKIGIKKAIRQDEAIYIIMQAYEKNSNRKIASITIKNRQSVQNIGAFQPVYRSYIYAAVELGVASNPNSKVLPSKQLTVEELIKMFYKAQTR